MRQPHHEQWHPARTQEEAEVAGGTEPSVDPLEPTADPDNGDDGAGIPTDTAAPFTAPTPARTAGCGS